jgi:hypothetical protein
MPLRVSWLVEIDGKVGARCRKERASSPIPSGIIGSIIVENAILGRSSIAFEASLKMALKARTIANVRRGNNRSEHAMVCQSMPSRFIKLTRSNQPWY